jgi:hypothetical protein
VQDTSYMQESTGQPHENQEYRRDTTSLASHCLCHPRQGFGSNRPTVRFDSFTSNRLSSRPRMDLRFSQSSS